MSITSWIKLRPHHTFKWLLSGKCLYGFKYNNLNPFNNCVIFENTWIYWCWYCKFFYLSSLLSSGRGPGNGLWPQGDRRGFIQIWTKKATLVSLCANMDLFLNPHLYQSKAHSHWVVVKHNLHLIFCFASPFQVKLPFHALAMRCLNLMAVAPTSLVFLFQRGYGISFIFLRQQGNLHF